MTNNGYDYDSDDGDIIYTLKHHNNCWSPGIGMVEYGDENTRSGCVNTNKLYLSKKEWLTVSGIGNYRNRVFERVS